MTVGGFRVRLAVWVGVVLVVVAVGGVLPERVPVAAVTEPGVPVDLMVQGIDVGAPLEGHEISMDEVGRAVGSTWLPPGPLRTAAQWDGNPHYWVSDADQEGGANQAQALAYPGTLYRHDAESQLSGDGTTFVATYMIETGDELGGCDHDSGDESAGVQYWHQQILIWQREDFDTSSEAPTSFGDPGLVTRQAPFDPEVCAFDIDGPTEQQPALMGVGGNERSFSPSVSRDGGDVGFVSTATDLGAAPTTAGRAAVYVWSESSGVEMVTPVGLDADVTEAMISGGGDHVVFATEATGLVSGVTVPAGTSQVYVATRGTGGWTFELASQSTAGVVGSDASTRVAIDRAGDRVAFVSDASNLDPAVAAPATGPSLVVRDLSTGVTRVARTRRDTPLTHHLGLDPGTPRLSEDGKSVVVYGSSEALGEDQVLLFDVNRMVSTDAEDRRTARRARRAFLINANGGEHVAIAGEDDDNLLAFPTEAAPLLRYQGSFLHLFMVGGTGIGPDVSRGWHGDPVDSASGAFRHDETDLSAPPGAGPVMVSRTYTSVGETAGVFGAGWMSDIDTSLELDVDGELVTLVLPNGQRLVFDGSSGAWVPLGEHRLSLTETLSGWAVADPSGRTWSFDEQGLVAGWTVPGQPSVEVVRDEGSITVTSAGGFEVELADWSYVQDWDPVAEEWVWVISPDPDGLVDQATTSDGRQVDYGYDRNVWPPVLTAVSRPHAPGQAAGTYGTRTYTMDGFLLTRIVDQVDATRTKTIVENTYDATGRVRHQITDTGDELDFAYGTKLDGLGNPVPAAGFTTVTNDASGDATVYEYDDSGAVVAITDALGNDVQRAWTKDQPATATSRSGVTTDHSYDDDGRVVEVTETAGATTRTIETVTYVTPDTSPAALTDDRVATRTDEAGVTTTFTYDGAAREPETVSVPCDPDSTESATPCPGSGKATTTYTYFSGAQAGLVESVTDPDGVVTEHTYAADRSVATTTTYDGTTPLVTTYETTRVGDPGWSETNPAAVEVRTTETPGGAVSTEVYDAEGRIIESRDPLYDGTTHLATTHTYTLDGELVSVTDPGGDVTTHAVARPSDPGWAEDPTIAEVRTTTGPDGVSSITKTDRSGDVVVEQRGNPVVPAELATTTHTYGPLGRLETTTDPMGVTTTYDYDIEGRATAVIDEDDESTETDYDAFGRPTVVTDPLSETTTTTYGPDGRITSTEDREGHDTTLTYDDAGRLHTTTDARGGVVEQTYTVAGRLAAETDATGRTTRYAYDTAGRQIEVELPSGATTTTDYDLDGRVASVTSPESRVTSYTYDDLGRPLTVADPVTGTTTTTYTPSGEVATRTDATGGEVELGYDGGQLTSVIDPLGRETTYAYDSRGNRTRRVDALDGEREWHWNLADQLTSEVDPLERTTTYTYDALGRLEIRTDGAGRTEDHGYDAAGQVTSLTYASGTPTTFGYDDEGRRTSMVDGTGTTTWSYNATGQMTGANLPGARDLAFAWDLAGRRTVVDYPDGARYRNRYDTNGRLSEVEFDDAGTWVDVAVNTYDDDGLLVEQDQGTSGARDWTYDAITGRTTSYADTHGGVTTTTSLTHDAAGRIASEITGGTSTVYDYDDAGQLTLVDRSTGTDETYAYDELGRRTTAVVGATTTTYQWDAASQVTRRVVDGVNHNYQYDTSGRRTREAWNGGANVLQWFWGARGTMTGQRFTEPGTVTDTSRATRGDGTLASLATTVNSTTTDTTDIVWDPTLGVPQPVWTGTPGGTNATRAVFGPDLIRFTCPTGTSCTGPAAHDVHGSALETTATSAVTQDTTYTPWGDGGPTYTAGADYGYRSELHTGATIHLRARDYDPDTGLFLSPDPLEGVDGTTTVNNPYHYTNNDPINSDDPLGLRPGDGALDNAPVGAACDEAGGRMVWYGDNSTKVCLEPPQGGRVDGESCWPNRSPQDEPIVWHAGSCQVKTTEIECARGPDAFNVICRNADAIKTVLWVTVAVALTVASAGAFAAAWASVGGGTGLVLSAGAGGPGLVAAVSPAVGQALIGSGVAIVGAGISVHMAGNGGGLHGGLREGDGDRGLEGAEIRDHADETYFQPSKDGARRVFVQHGPGDQRKVAIYEMGNTDLVTVIRMTAREVASKVASARWVINP